MKHIETTPFVHEIKKLTEILQDDEIVFSMNVTPDHVDSLFGHGDEDLSEEEVDDKLSDALSYVIATSILNPEYDEGADRVTNLIFDSFQKARKINPLIGVRVAMRFTDTLLTDLQKEYREKSARKVQNKKKNHKKRNNG